MVKLNDTYQSALAYEICNDPFYVATNPDDNDNNNNNNN
jgi:hypothetical protein